MKVYRTVQYAISIPEHGRETACCRLAYLSDLHNCCSPPETEEILRRLDRISPDAVLCGGDMIVAIPGMTADAAAGFFRRLSENWPVYAATGNHEYRARLYPETYGTLYDDYRAALEGSGCVLLENRSVKVTYGSMTMRICGFDMPVQYYDRKTRKPLPAVEIGNVFGRPDADAVNVLLAHHPKAIPASFSWGADITLCGHYHGGVARLTKNRGLISTEFRLFPRNVCGHFQTEGKHAIISAGCGEHSVHLRIRNPREIVSLVLRTSG